MTDVGSQLDALADAIQRWLEATEAEAEWLDEHPVVAEWLAIREAAAEQRGAERVAAAIEEVLRDPATSWWHTGGTRCVPARAIRARLADQGATP